MAKVVEIRSKHRALMRLRGKLTWRRFTKETGRFVGVVFALIFFVPMSLGMSIGSWFGYTHAPDHWPFQILGFILVGLWLSWIVFPLFVASITDSMSLDNLLIYPLTRRDLVISNLLGTLFDYQSYIAFPLLLTMVVAFGGFGRFSNPASTLLMLPLLVIVVIVAWVMMVASSQLVLTALGGVLQSRRTRDVAVVLLSFSGIGCWFISQLAPRATEFLEETVQLESSQVAEWQPLLTMQWLPPGALARSIEQASSGLLVGSLLWLAYGIGWMLLLTWAWGFLLNRLLTGQGFLLGGGGSSAGAPVEKRKRTTWGLGWLQGVISAETRFIAAKELKAIWRVPQRRIGLLQAFMMPIFFTAVPLMQSDSPLSSLELGPNVAAGLPIYTLFFFWVLSQNMIGWEHSGLPMLLTMPIKRERIFLGKSIALLIVGIPPIVLLGIVLTVYTGDITILFWTMLGMAMALPCLAVAAVVSARFPYPVQLNFKTNRSSFSRGGCLAAIVVLIPVPLSFLLLNLPLIAPILAWYFAPQYQWAALIVAGLGVIWAVFIFRTGMRIAGKTLMIREPESIAAARPTKND